MWDTTSAVQTCIVNCTLHVFSSSCNLYSLEISFRIRVRMYKQWSADLNSDAMLMWKQSESSMQPNGEKTSPISVILVSSGSRGNKLLFRYPFQKVSENTSSAACKCSCFLFCVCVSSWLLYWVGTVICMSAYDECLPDTGTPAVIYTFLTHFYCQSLYTCNNIHEELNFSRCVFLCH